MAGGKKKTSTKHNKKKGRPGHPDRARGRKAPVDERPALATTSKTENPSNPLAALDGGQVRGRGRLTEMVPVRFDLPTLTTMRERAAEDHRSVSSWIRRAVDHELGRSESAP
jgi:hypothetical protein